MKTPWVSAAILALCCCVACPAEAGTLVTGVVRDQAGAAVAAARIRAFDGAGTQVGSDASSADGTFALDVDGDPVALTIDCAYCAELRLPLEGGRPAIAIVRRYRALSEPGIEPGDAAALPYRRTAELASLLPFAAVRGNAISDRGLDRGRGAVLLDGVPMYRVLDGADPATLVPAGMTAGLQSASPLGAPLYGAYANGGTFAFTTGAPEAPSRVDAGDAFDAALRAGTALHGTLARSADPGPNSDRRTAASAGAALPFAGGALALSALAVGASAVDGRGAALRYTTGSRRYETSAALSLSGGSAAGSGRSNDVRLDVHVRSRGPLAIEAGARLRRSGGAFDVPSSDGRGAQLEDALYADAATRVGTGTLSAALALQRDGDVLDGYAALRANAIVSSLAYDVAAGSHWTLHAAAGGGLREPALAELAADNGAAFGRSALIEGAVRYTDGSRVRLEATAYGERTPAAGDARLGGIGVSGVWQIAPALTLRGWMLRSDSTSDQPRVNGGYGPLAVPLRANLLWLSYGGALRIDVLARGGPFEGDLVVPLSARTALAFGTFERSGARITTLGVRAR